MRKENTKSYHVTFAVDCTYTVTVDASETDKMDDIIAAAWQKVNGSDISIGDLENPCWEQLQVDQIMNINLGEEAL